MQQTSTRFTPNPGMSLRAMRSTAPLSAAALPSFDADGLDAQASLNRLQQLVGFLDNALRLPDNARTFSIYLAGLLVIFAGAFLHVLVAAQITQARHELSVLEEQYMVLEQENGDLLFKIADGMNMARLYGDAVAQGYTAPQDREYVFIEAPVVEAPAPVVEMTAAVTPAPALAPAANTAPLQSWQEFWLRAWMPDPQAEAAPQAANPLATMGTTVTSWWDQTTGRAEKLLDQMLGR